jgi:hypothetical protein
MSIPRTNTYCRGFRLVAIKNISKKEFVELCNNLQKEFNDYYNSNDYSFSPECITEGGIVFNNFGMGSTNGYKTMRIYFTDKFGGMKQSLYGMINDHIKDEWINDESILIDKDKYLGTYLKSFYNAPQWTNDELKIFEKCFNNIGLIVNKLPTKKELASGSNYYLKLFYP